MSIEAAPKRPSVFGAFTLRRWVMIVVLAFLAAAPVLADKSLLGLDLNLMTRFVCLAIAAVSLNLILGFGGMISFGHAAYIGLGAYCVGIPAYYEYTSGYLHFPLTIVVCALFALITGALCLRTKGVYFIMITMAFSQMAFFFFVSLDEYGGDDGLTIDYRSEFAGLLDMDNKVTLYYVCFISLLIAIYVVHRIINSRFGMVIRGARSNEQRMKALGYNTYAYRLTCYVISGVMCGYAGALLGNFTNFISPEMMDWTRSGELMFMVIVGGSGSLFGPVLGTLGFLGLEDVLPQMIKWIGAVLQSWGYEETGKEVSSAFRHWKLIFGIILILTVLFARGGIDGLLKAVERILKSRKDLTRE